MFSVPRAHASPKPSTAKPAKEHADGDDNDEEEDDEKADAAVEKQPDQALPPPAELGLGPDVISLATVPYTDLLASGMRGR